MTVNRQKILLADDSITIRKVVELTFADEGIDVYSVADGDAAMQKFVEIEPDLVIADVNMPGMSGYQICEMIKQDESTSDIPVILLVGSFEPFDAGEASRVGSNYYFTKPFRSIRDLVGKVKEYLELGSVDGTEPETTDIDALYQQSILVPDEDESPLASFDDLTVAEPIAEPEPPADTVEGPIAETAEEPAVEPVVDTAMEHVVETALEPAEPAVSEPSQVELGDAGMDDEMIETSHPGSDDIVPAGRPVIDPFESTVAMDDVIADEPAATPIKFAIDDEEVAGEVDRFAPRDAVSLNADNVSPELIDIIVARVIERMSDTAVRDAARESVPRIAEKLIREALDQSGRK